MHQEAVECLMVMIYSPYTHYLVKYKSYEEALLLKELNNIRLVSTFYDRLNNYISNYISSKFR